MNNRRERESKLEYKLPQHVATTIIDSLRNQTHQANASSSINQVNIPFNLKQPPLIKLLVWTCLSVTPKLAKSKNKIKIKNPSFSYVRHYQTLLYVLELFLQSSITNYPFLQLTLFITGRSKFKPN